MSVGSPSHNILGAFCISAYSWKVILGLGGKGIYRTSPDEISSTHLDAMASGAPSIHAEGGALRSIARETLILTVGSVCMTQIPSSACEFLDSVIDLKKDERFTCHIIPVPCLGYFTINATEP